LFFLLSAEAGLLTVVGQLMFCAPVANHWPAALLLTPATLRWSTLSFAARKEGISIFFLNSPLCYAKKGSELVNFAADRYTGK
jgi:hypothetical protein